MTIKRFNVVTFDFKQFPRFVEIRYEFPLAVTRDAVAFVLDEDRVTMDR